jgi:protein-disulfide isomerase
MPIRQLARAIGIFALVLTTGAANAQDAPAGARSKAMEDTIRNFILENPEIIVEALEKYEAKQRKNREKAATAALVAHRDALFNHPMTPVSGNSKGDVTVVEFFDYQCGFCKRAMSSVVSLIKEDPKVRVVWKEFPILGPVSEYAARAAMAARKQDKYFEFHVAVMGARGKLTPRKVIRLAEKAGLDTARLKKDMADPAISKYLNETIRLAQALGINGTPGFVIGDKVVRGLIDKSRMKALIDAVRKQS